MKTMFFWSKAGRNDPCPCGSGLKFKKCCLDKPYQPSKELLDDFALGQQLIDEYETAQERTNPDYRRVDPDHSDRNPVRNRMAHKLILGSLGMGLVGNSSILGTTFKP